jgi:hypothetical protein
MGSPPVATIGTAGFAALTWGAIGLVLVVFGYLVWSLFDERTVAT